MFRLCTDMVPMGLVPVATVAEFLGVEPEQVIAWCKAGTMRAQKHTGEYWVRVDSLGRFVEASRWVLAADPTGTPVTRIVPTQGAGVV